MKTMLGKTLRALIPAVALVVLTGCGVRDDGAADGSGDGGNSGTLASGSDTSPISGFWKTRGIYVFITETGLWSYAIESNTENCYNVTDHKLTRLDNGTLYELQDTDVNITMDAFVEDDGDLSIQLTAASGGSSAVYTPVTSVTPADIQVCEKTV